MDYKTMYEQLLQEHNSLTEKYNNLFKCYKHLINVIIKYMGGDKL